MNSTHFAFLPNRSLKDLLGPKNTSSSESESEVNQTANVIIIFWNFTANMKYHHSSWSHYYLMESRSLENCTRVPGVVGHRHGGQLRLDQGRGRIRISWGHFLLFFSLSLTLSCYVIVVLLPVLLYSSFVLSRYWIAQCFSNKHYKWNRYGSKLWEL